MRIDQVGQYWITVRTVLDLSGLDLLSGAEQGQRPDKAGKAQMEVACPLSGNGHTFESCRVRWESVCRARRDFGAAQNAASLRFYLYARLLCSDYAAEPSFLVRILLNSGSCTHPSTGLAPAQSEGQIVAQRSNPPQRRAHRLRRI